MATFNLSEPWDINPTSSSAYEIYQPDDQWIMGNATDATKKYDTTDFTDLEGGAPKGNIFSVYKFRLMISGDPVFPHRVWYSHIYNAEGWSKDTNWIDIYPEDGGKINGHSIQNDELIISKDNGKKYGWRIYADGDPTNSRLRIIDDTKGNLTPRSATDLSNIHYYLDRNAFFNLSGTSTYSDSASTSVGGLSFIVDSVIKGIRDFTIPVLGSNNNEVYIALGTIDLDIGEVIVINNAVLVYDVVNDGFYIRDNIDARVFTRFIDVTGDDDLYFGTSSGKVMKMNDGNLAGNDPIHMRIRTKKYFVELGQNIVVNKVGVYMDNPDNTLVTYRTTDTDQRSMLGTITDPNVQWLDAKEAKGKFFEMEFVHSNTNVRPTLKGFSIIWHPEGTSNKSYAG